MNRLSRAWKILQSAKKINLQASQSAKQQKDDEDLEAQSNCDMNESLLDISVSDIVSEAGLNDSFIEQILGDKESQCKDELLIRVKQHEESQGNGGSGMIQGGEAERIQDRGAKSIQDGGAEPIEGGAETILEGGAEAIEDGGAETILEGGVEPKEDGGAKSIQDRGAETILEAGVEPIEDGGAETILEAGVEPIEDGGAETILEAGAEPIEDGGAETIEGGGVETIIEAGAEPIEAETVQEGGAETILEAGAEPIEDGGAETIAHAGAEPIEDGGAETILEAEAEPIEDGGAETMLEAGAEPIEDGGAETMLEAEAETILEAEAEPIEDGGAETMLETGAETMLETGAETMLEAGAETILEAGAETILEVEAEPIEDGGAETIEDGGAETIGVGGAETMLEAGAEPTEIGGAETMLEAGAEPTEDGGAETILEAGAEPIEDGGAETIGDGRAETMLEGEVEPIQDGGVEPIQDGGVEPIQDGGVERIQDGGVEPIQDGREGTRQLGESEAMQTDESEAVQHDGDNDQADKENTQIDTMHEHHGTRKRTYLGERNWKIAVNQTKRMRGEKYTGKKYTDSGKAYTWEEKAPRIMGPRCDCHAVFAQCKEISEEERKGIFSYIWSLSWPEKKVYVSSMVSVTNVEKRKVLSEEYRRNTSVTYRLKAAARYFRVCKQMFLSTTGLTDYFVRTYARPLEPQVPEAPKQKQTGVQRESVRQFIASLPKMPSHYCRKETSKVYVEPLFNSYLHFFNVYEGYCKEENKKAASRKVFMDELNANNISIFKPKKDMCDTCLSFDTGNLDETAYNEHREAKDRARSEMTMDIEEAANSGKTRVLTMDLQCVLLCPSIQASALYYRTKLCVHNFTIFDCNSHETRCYVWHDAEGGLSAQEFASCLFDFLSSDTTCEKYVIWSDGCTYQNRNVSMAKAMSLFAQANKKEVQQKFLIKGHTQMEVDSVHSCIQRAIGKQPIHCPSDYIRIMKAARRSSKGPYDVRFLEHTFFKDFSNSSSLKSIRPGKKAGEPVVTDIRAIRYAPDGEVTTKLHFDGNWQPLPMKRGETTLLVQDPAPLYCSRRAIPATKYRHLQELKPYIPADLHSFYDNLPHD